MSPGIIANPFAAGIGRKNSLESISSIDRDLSPEELEILQKVGVLAAAGRRMGSGLPSYGVSSSQHFCQECTRMGL